MKFPWNGNKNTNSLEKQNENKQPVPKTLIQRSFGDTMQVKNQLTLDCATEKTKLEADSNWYIFIFPIQIDEELVYAIHSFL